MYLSISPSLQPFPLNFVLISSFESPCCFFVEMKFLIGLAVGCAGVDGVVG